MPPSVLPMSVNPLLPHMQQQQQPPSNLSGLPQQTTSVPNTMLNVQNLSNMNAKILYDGQQQHHHHHHQSHYLQQTDVLLNAGPNQIKSNIISDLSVPKLPSNISSLPLDGIMSESQFYQYQERLRKEKE